MTRIDPLEMVYDCKSQKRNLADSRRNWWVREVDIEDAKRMSPGTALADLDAAWARLSSTNQPHDREAARQYAGGLTSEWDPKRRTVTMVHCEYCIVESGYRAANVDTGEVMDVEQEQLKTLRENAKVAGVNLKISRQPKKVYYTAVLGAKVLSYDKSQSQKAFARQAITGYRDRNKKQWVGLVRGMRDPQKWANALFSSVLHQIQVSGKGVMMEKDAVDNVQQAERDWANASKIVWVKTGALGQHPKVKQKDQNSIPAGTMELMQFALSSFRDVTGVNVEAMGLADRQQAASLEYQRRQAASTILAPFFDGFRRYRKEQGRLTLDLMRKLLSDNRLVRVVGPDYERYVPLMRDDDTLQYDIIIDEAPSSPNQKEANWMILQQMLPVIAKDLSPAVVGKLMKASPLPESVVNDFIEAAEKESHSQGPSPEQMQAEMQAQQMQFEMAQGQQKAELESAKLQADLQIKGVDLQIELAKLEQLKLKTVAEIQTAQFNMQGAAEQRAFDRESQQADQNFKLASGQHEMAMRQMELESAESQETMKAFGKDFPGQMQQAQVQQTEQMKLLAEAIKALAQAMNSPRVTEIADPVSGETLRAVSRVEEARMN